MLSDLLVPPYQAVTVVSSTGSTNADQRAAAAAGAPDRSVLLAREQTAGRGRRDRAWSSPKGAGLYCSVLYRPDGVPAARLGTVTVVAGVALARACAELDVRAGLKWPNDLLVGQRKLCGILAEAVDGAVVLGIGLNLAPMAETVPAGTGGLERTSLAECGSRTSDFDQVAVSVLTELDRAERAWRAAGADLAAAGLLDEYRAGCVTLGRPVRVERSGDTVEATATDVDADGRLVLDDGQVVSAGDVVHLRPR